MEEGSRKAVMFFIMILLPLILFVVSFIPGIANILLTIVSLVWLGFSIFMIGPIRD